MGEGDGFGYGQLSFLHRPPPSPPPPRRLRQTPSRCGSRGKGAAVGEIVEVQGGHVVRATGRKDRHSKVCTAKGPRERRVRLSAHTAIQFYDVQDRLGYDRPSKVVDWLIKNAKAAIDELAELPAWIPTATVAVASSHSPSLLPPSYNQAPVTEHPADAATAFNLARGGGGEHVVIVFFRRPCTLIPIWPTQSNPSSRWLQLLRLLRRLLARPSASRPTLPISLRELAAKSKTYASRSIPSKIQFFTIRSPPTTTANTTTAQILLPTLLISCPPRNWPSRPQSPPVGPNRASALFHGMWWRRAALAVDTFSAFRHLRLCRCTLCSATPNFILRGDPFSPATPPLSAPGPALSMPRPTTIRCNLCRCPQSNLHPVLASQGARFQRGFRAKGSTTALLKSRPLLPLILAADRSVRRGATVTNLHCTSLRRADDWIPWERVMVHK